MDELTLAIAAIAWGLLAASALAHVGNYELLRSHLALHMDRDRLAAGLLVTWETLLTIAFPIAVLAASTPFARLTGAAFALTGIGFVLWVARLVAIGSDKPCACSSSDAPPTTWSIVRAALIITGGLLAVAATNDLATVDEVVALAAGAALGATMYVLPDALSWPPSSRAQLARLDAHAPRP